MEINPIIPIWLMGIICAGLLVVKRKGVLAYIRQILIVILLFVINLRIMIPGEVVNVGKQKMDLYVMFVVDDTISMLAQDYNGTEERLSGVRETVHHIVDELDGAKFGAVSFHNNANVLSPFSDNSDHIKNVIDALYPPGEIYAHGTSLNLAYEPMELMLKQAYNKGDGPIAVIFISDGEITDDSKLQSFAPLAKYISGGAVLGYGTTAGANMYVKYYYNDEYELVEDTSTWPYAPAVSRIDETNLNLLSKDMNIDYIHVLQPSDVDPMISSVGRLAEVSMENSDDATTKTINGATDIYYYFAIPLMALLIWEAAIMLMRKKKK